MSLKITNLVKTYGTQNAVNNISFEAKEGEILGLLGPNGAGKSTTMKISTGYIPPTSGTVTVYGNDVVQNQLEVKRITGYLPESNPLYYDMYVHEFLHFIGSLHGIGGKKLTERTQEMIEICGLTVEQNKKIGTLSKGYKQRVGLAQALIHDPKVLILDEPTSGLDPNQILEIRKLIQNVSKNKTVILSTHIMQEVKAICDRIVIINKGNIVYNDSIHNIEKVNSGGQVIQVQFSTKVNIQVFNIQGVSKIEEKEANTYLFTIAADKDLRSELFKIAADNNCLIIEMKLLDNSLESVFQFLTVQ